MGTGKDLTLHVNDLLTNYAQYFASHLSAIESDLSQASLLLEDATVNLTHNFAVLNTAFQAQMQMIDGYVNTEGGDGCHAYEIEQLSEKIETAIHHSITNLQFQDMHRQIMEGVTKRVSGLQRLGKELCIAQMHGASENDEKEFHALLNQIVANGRLVNEDIVCNVGQLSVEQKHMESGDVDLF